MSSGKHRQSPALDLRFDTSDISFAAPAKRPPRVVRIPTRPPFPARMPSIPVRAAAPAHDHDDLATGSVVAVVTEDAEPIYIHDRRDTLEQPPLRRPRESAPPTEVSDDPTAPMEAPRDLIAAKRGIPPLRF